MSRKILSLIVAVAFVLTTISTAFAATLPTDVTGDATKAVSEMQSLNIMIGDAGTGLFRPNDTIKRSEFAVVAVKAMGLNDTAVISAGATKFSDVAADNWASGYVNAAVGAGLISGYPDGTFQPDKTINYAEAVTILGNMLGYGPILAGKPWPSAYVAQANVSGITTGVVMAPTVGASRGNVAKLVSNTLGANELQISSYDVSGKPIYATTVNNATKTLMEDKLSVTQVIGAKNTDGHSIDYKEFQVTNTPSLQTGSTVGNSTLTDTDNGRTVKSLDFVSGLNPNDYLGLNVNAWTNTDNKVVVAQVTNNTSDIYDGVVSQDGSNLKLNGKSTSYGATSDFKGYLNGTPAAFSAIVTAVANDQASGRVVLSNGLVKFASVWGATTAAAGQTVSAFNVNTITGGYIRAIGPSQSDLKIQDVKDGITNQTRRYDITRNGKAATIDDVKANDVVLYVVNGNHYVMTVTNNEVKGNLSGISGNDVGMTLTIGGKGYTMSANGNIFSNDGTPSDGGKVTNATIIANTGTTGITQYIGKDVTVELNAVGQISLLNCTTTAQSYYYGIIKNFANNVGTNMDYAVVLYKQDGTKVSYLFDDDTNVTSYTSPTAATVKGTAGPVALVPGMLVQYQLTSAGKISGATLTDAANVTADSQVYAATSTIAPSNNYINISAGHAGVISSATTIFSIYDMLNSNGDATLVNYSAIDNNKYPYVLLIKNGLVTAMSVNQNNIAAGTTGVVVNTGYDTDGRTVIVNVAGTEKTYKVVSGTTPSTNDYAYLKAGTFISYDLDSAGKFKQYHNLVDSVLGDNYLSTFVAGDSHIFRVMGIDTANHVLDVKVLDTNGITAGTYAEGGSDIYYRYDPTNLDVYDVTDKANNNIVGGKDMSLIQKYDYVWLGGEGASTAKNDFTKLLKIKVDDLVKTYGGSH